MANIRIDALTSATLNHLRERWWGPEFTEFLTDMLKPRAGNRILDVGCGAGTAEVHIGQHVSQTRLVGVDLILERVMRAKRETAAHNQRARFATADACRLPFRDGVFDSTFCVAVLQHVGEVDEAVREFVRVTRIGGRVVAVEPDNSARYWHASSAAGFQAFEMSTRFFAALAEARGDVTDARVGPRLPGLFGQYGIEPLDVRLFPVSRALLGAPADEVWRQRRAVIEEAVTQAPTDAVRALGRDYLGVLDAYAADARRAPSAFVEIQVTMLFATVGQKSE